MRPGLLRLVRQRGHRHQTDDFDARHGRHVLGQVGDGPDGDAELGLFVGDVDLDEHLDPLVELDGLVADLIGQPEAVERMNHLDPGHDLADLVPLKMADHVPVRGAGGVGIKLPPAREVLLDHAGPLDQLLHPALAQVEQADLEPGPDYVHFDGLGDRDAPDLLGPPATAGTGGGDPIANAFEIIRQFSTHGLFCSSSRKDAETAVFSRERGQETYTRKGQMD